jgi:ABC-type tungstate transport system permease subunit
MKRTVAILFLLSLLLNACVPTASDAPANPNIILATTTSTQDSGLLDVLVPLFEAESGYTVQTVAVGTGAALKMAEEGNADVLLVHAPSSEVALMEAQHGPPHSAAGYAVVWPQPRCRAAPHVADRSPRAARPATWGRQDHCTWRSRGPP